MDGATSADGLVAGTYVHGLSAADSFRRAFLAGAGVASSLGYEASIDVTLDRLADHLERHVAIDRLLRSPGYSHSTQAAMPATSAKNRPLAAR